MEGRLVDYTEMLSHHGVRSIGIDRLGTVVAAPSQPPGLGDWRDLRSRQGLGAEAEVHENHRRPWTASGLP